MPTQVPKKPDATTDVQRVNASIGQHVMQRLGQPGDLQQVQVRPLWVDHYRVNVVTGRDMSSVKIAHSYFLVTDGVGNVLVATPEITRRY